MNKLFESTNSFTKQESDQLLMEGRHPLSCANIKLKTSSFVLSNGKLHCNIKVSVLTFNKYDEFSNISSMSISRSIFSSVALEPKQRMSDIQTQ